MKMNKLFKKTNFSFLKKNNLKFSKKNCLPIYHNFHSTTKFNNDEIDVNYKESIGDYDVAIVGAGPSGLAAAIHLKKLSSQYEKDLKICVFEKAAEVGQYSKIHSET